MTRAGRPRIGRAINLTVPEVVVAAARATADRETAGGAKVTTSAVLRRWLIAGAEARKNERRRFVKECAHCSGDGFEPMTGKWRESHACSVCGGDGEVSSSIEGTS